MLFTFFFVLFVYAEDYEIRGCGWDETYGKIFAVWEKAESSTQYRVRLYKDGHQVGNGSSVSGDRKEFTSKFLKEGPGKYHFEVYPVKGSRELTVSSEELELDAEYYLALKHIENEAKRTKSTKSTNLDSDGITIQNCSLYLFEKPGEDDCIRQIELTRGSYSTVTIAAMSAAFEDWQPGKKITITAQLYPDSGYIFSDNVNISCSNAEITGKPVKIEGNGLMVTLDYYPVMKIKKPENIYIDENERLRWDGSEHTGRYRICFYSGGDIIALKYTESKSVDVSEQLGEDCDEIRITALAPSKARRIRSSDITVFTDVDIYCPEGWQYRSGFWYYYVEGRKCEPGWFEDKDGHRYYFDSKSRMKTGSVLIDGDEYFFNDGTYENIPVGALSDNS